jgi:hypothetical protein
VKDLFFTFVKEGEGPWGMGGPSLGVKISVLCFYIRSKT